MVKKVVVTEREGIPWLVSTVSTASTVAGEAGLESSWDVGVGVSVGVGVGIGVMTGSLLLRRKREVRCSIEEVRLAHWALGWSCLIRLWLWPAMFGSVDLPQRV